LYTFDPAAHQDYAQIDSAPHGVKLRSDNENLLYVNMEKGGKILVFDLTTRSIIKKFDVSPNTHNLFFSADGKTLWLMAGKDGIVHMDPDTGKILGTFALPTPIRGFKYTPDHQSLMLSAVNQIVFIDPVTLKIQKEFSNLGVGPILYSDITPDQKYIVAPAAFDNQILIIDVQTKAVVKRIVTGLNPVTVMMDTEGKYAYVTNATDKHITKIDMRNFTTTNIYTKEGPNGLAFVPFSSKQPHKKLNLGVALPLSGPDASRGRDMMRGYEYWRLMMSRAGGLLVQDQVYDVNIVYLDTQSDVSQISPLTKELINTYQINMLLSTYGLVGYNIEKQISLENHLPLTPAQTNESPWLPNEMAVGKDYFVTTQFYEKKYYAEYNFKASTYSASATSLGIVLQEALGEANSFDYEKLTKAMSHQFPTFFQY
jgi:glutamine cyclotransferase